MEYYKIVNKLDKSNRKSKITMMEIDSTLRKPVKYFNYVFTFIFGCLFLGIIFKNLDARYNFEIGKSLLAMSAVILLWGSLFGISYFMIGRHETRRQFVIKHEKWFLAVGFVLLFGIQLLIINSAITTFGWDCGELVSVACSDDMNGAASYFSLYPNNLLLLLIFRVVSKLIPFADMWWKLDILNAVWTDVSLLLIFLVVKKLKGRTAGYQTLIMAVTGIGFWGWLIVPYSDIWAMPFTIGIVYTYLNLRDAASNRGKVIISIIISTLTLVGFLIKPTVIIGYIAVLIIQLFSKMKKKEWKKNLLCIVICGFTLFLGILGWQTYTYKQQNIILSKDLAMPVSHYFMMGLYDSGTEYGVINTEDVNLSYSYLYDKEAKVAMNMQVAKERLVQKGFKGYLIFLEKKARWTTSEGTFFWGCEGGFAEFEKDNKNFMQELTYTNGKYYDYYAYYLQGLWICVMGLITLPVFAKGVTLREQELKSIMRCAIFGLLLFLLLFEARTRYLILYLPVMYALAGMNLNDILRKIRNRRREK